MKAKLKQRKPATFIFIGLFACIGIYLIINSKAAVLATSISYENGNTTQCTGGVNTTNATFSPTNLKSYDGSYSSEAVLADHSGGAVNAYARCVVTVSWDEGDDVWYGGAYFLPSGFASGSNPMMQGEVDLMRWDNFSLNNTSQDWGGIIIQNSDKLARIKRFNATGDYVDVSPAFQFPENKWTWIEVHQKFSSVDGQALNEIFVDGVLKGTSTTANTYGREITRIRYGLVAIDSSKQKNALNLWTDRNTISYSKLGPLNTTPTCTKAADINCDNAVNVTDLSILLSNYGKTTAQLASSTPSYPRADINSSGKVEIGDLSALLTGYGK